MTSIGIVAVVATSESVPVDVRVKLRLSPGVVPCTVNFVTIGAPSNSVHRETSSPLVTAPPIQRAGLGASAFTAMYWTCPAIDSR